MTQLLVSDMPRRMGRKKQWAEDMQARFPEGTFDRIAVLLEGKEDRTDFVRAAVEREIRRRERAARLSGHSKPEDDGAEGLSTFRVKWDDAA